MKKKSIVNNVNCDSRGKFRAEEIAIVVDSDSLLIPEITKKFSGKLENKSMLNIFKTSSGVKGLFRWTHRKYSFGGACNIDISGSEVLPYAVIEISPLDFVSFLNDSLNGNHFEALSVTIKKYMEDMITQEKCPNNTRLSILIIGFEKYQSSYSKNNNFGSHNHSLHISQLYDNAIAFLLCEHSVEVVSLKSTSDAADYLHGITRCLMNEPYRNLDDEIDCISRFSKKMKSIEGFSSVETHEHISQITWINTLRVIPGVSERVANKIAEKFKSSKELLLALNSNNLSPLDQVNFINEVISNNSKSNTKLAKKIVRVYTSITENEMINSDAE